LFAAPACESSNTSSIYGRVFFPLFRLKFSLVALLNFFNPVSMFLTTDTAADKRKNPKPLYGYFIATIIAQAIRTFTQARKRIVNKVKHF